jgi:hypothetical protein
MLNPKLIAFHKNLPEITDKRELNALRKGMFPATNSSFVHLEKISDIIINVFSPSFRPTPFPSKYIYRAQKDSRPLCW